MFPRKPLPKPQPERDFFGNPTTPAPAATPRPTTTSGGGK
jgi:hypothetical protein